MKISTYVILGLLPLSASVALAAKPFVETDFPWNEATSLHKQMIIDGVNQFASENPDCAVIDPASLRLDMEHGNPDYPSYAINCGEGDQKHTIFFTELDVKSKPAPARKRQQQP